jgi:hypothetical protein
MGNGALEGKGKKKKAEFFVVFSSFFLLPSSFFLPSD